MEEKKPFIQANTASQTQQCLLTEVIITKNINNVTKLVFQCDNLIMLHKYEEVIHKHDTRFRFHTWRSVSMCVLLPDYMLLTWTQGGALYPDFGSLCFRHCSWAVSPSGDLPALLQEQLQVSGWVFLLSSCKDLIGWEETAHRKSLSASCCALSRVHPVGGSTG